MEPNSIINSLKDLSDLEDFATTIEFLFDVGCLLHGQNYTYYGNTSDVIVLSQYTSVWFYHPLLFQYLWK